MSCLDGSEGLAALGDLLEREPRLGDGVSRQDEGEDPAVLGDLLEREPRLGAGVSRQDESEGPAGFSDPLEREPRLGDGEDVDSLGDDLENANGTAVAD